MFGTTALLYCVLLFQGWLKIRIITQLSLIVCKAYTEPSISAANNISALRLRQTVSWCSKEIRSGMWIGRDNRISNLKWRILKQKIPIFAKPNLECDTQYLPPAPASFLSHPIRTISHRTNMSFIFYFIFMV